MEIIKDFFNINKSTLKKSVNSITSNWIIIFSGIIYTILNVAIYAVVGTIFRGVLFILAGFILAIVSSSLISNYLYLLYNVINYDRIKLDDFKEGFKYFLWKIYGVFFIAWIGSYILSALGGILRSNSHMLSTLISILILFLLNALPETLYLKHLSAGESIMYALEFMKENWINWLIPNVIFYLILYVLTGNILTNLFTTHLSFNFDFSIQNILRYLLGQILFSFIMIYRGHLFKLLSTSTRRKRMFMNKF